MPNHLRLSALVLAATLALHVGSASADPYRGTAAVIDGDTLEIHGFRIRLHGVDVPESSQTCTSASLGTWLCGQRAAFALADMIQRRPVSCHRRDTDRYGRIIAACDVGGVSVNRWLVRNGWATAYTHYSRDYVADEALAKANQLNIWSGEFIDPAQYRRNRGKPPEAAPADGCRLKGNINADGDRIFHAPCQQHYERTRIDTAAGERWFCTADEAAQAGWRPARGR